MSDTARRTRARRRFLRQPGHQTLGFASPRKPQPPDEEKVRRNRIYLIALPFAAALVFGLWTYFRLEPAPPQTMEKQPEMKEVEVAPPPPPPEPEPEEASSEPSSDPTPAGPSALDQVAPDVAMPQAGEANLDLALGSGAEGLAIAGAGGGSGGGGGGRFVAEAGAPDKSPEVIDDGGAFELPRKALDAGVSGKFEAVFTVNAQGRPEGIQIKGGPAGYGFEEAIRKAVARRRYRPAETGGVAVAARVAIPFDLRIDP